MYDDLVKESQSLAEKGLNEWFTNIVVFTVFDDIRKPLSSNLMIRLISDAMKPSTDDDSYNPRQSKMQSQMIDIPKLTLKSIPKMESSLHQYFDDQDIDSSSMVQYSEK